jgi:hypothetical protein
LVKPILFKVVHDRRPELGMILQEGVIPIKLDGLEGREDEEGLSFLLGSSWAAREGPIEVSVPDEEGPRVVLLGWGRDREDFLCELPPTSDVPLRREGVGWRAIFEPGTFFLVGAWRGGLVRRVFGIWVWSFSFLWDG